MEYRIKQKLLFYLRPSVHQMKAEGDKNIGATSIQAFASNYDQTTKSFCCFCFTRLLLFLKETSRVQAAELNLSRKLEIRAFQRVPLQLTSTTKLVLSLRTCFKVGVSLEPLGRYF